VTHSSAGPPAEVAVVDVRDERALRAWWEVVAAVEADRPTAPFPDWPVARTRIVAPHPSAEVVLHLARRDGEVVGAARTSVLLDENPHLGLPEVWVAAHHRRAGVGSTLLRTGEAWAVERGRTVLLTEVASALGATAPGVLFAQSHGYDVAGANTVRAADLRATEPTWPALDQRVAAAGSAATVQVFVGVPPPPYDARLCALLDRFVDEIPLGDVALEGADWTPERVRARIAAQEAAGRTRLTVLALAADGSPAGFADVTLSPASPRLAEIGSTLVHPHHRGRRLGLALKLTLHRELRARCPGCEVVRTENAEVNTAMAHVNDQLGYVAVETTRDLQKRLSTPSSGSD